MVTEIQERPILSAFSESGQSLSHALPIPENGCPLCPFQIVSLLKMLTMKHASFCAGNGDASVLRYLGK
jgi:hypothetical protein